MTFSSIKTATTTAEEAARQTQLKIDEISSEELALLKTNDPFMYYSIPFIRESALLNKDEGEIALTSTPDEGSTVVTRKSRISFEYHSDKILGDLLDLDTSDFDSNDDSEEEDEDDDFYSFLWQLKKEAPSILPSASHKDAKPKETCPCDLASQDLAELRENDPFLVKIAAMLKKLANAA